MNEGMIIEGLRAGHVGLISGPAGSWKTRLALSVALTAATGRELPPIIGHDKPTRVLFLDLECRASRLQRIVQRMIDMRLTAEEEETANRHLFIAWPGADDRKEYLEDYVASAVSRVGPELLIVEGFGMKALKPFIDIAELDNCAVLLTRPRVGGSLYTTGAPMLPFELSHLDLYMDVDLSPDGKLHTIRFVKSHDNIHWPHNFMKLCSSEPDNLWLSIEQG